MSTKDEKLAAVVAAAEEALFERFNRLHAKDIHDGDVISFLRAEGHTLLATRYIEWSGAVDPDSDEDNTTMNPVVPDPGDAPSYEALADQLDAVKDAASPALSTPAIDRFLQQARGEAK
jgi:hypothetical protein